MSPSPYAKCLLCPRRCGVNREAGERGFCGESAGLRLAFAGIHRGEEPPITGQGGSGTIFVSGCNLGCVFCQNYQISRDGAGRAVSPGEFARICLALQDRGAENINIVTGSHAAPAIAEGLRLGRELGLRLPALWNTSSYEGPETLALLEGLVDRYLPDLKTLDSALAERFFHAPDYPEHAVRAILAMADQRPGGMILRHLVLPGFLESTRQVLRWFAGTLRGRARLSLMTQYTPAGPEKSGAPDRFVNKAEYEAVLGWLEEFGIDEGFYQELVPGDEWLPDFTRSNPFSSDLSLPVWHWRVNSSAPSTPVADVF